MSCTPCLTNAGSKSLFALAGTGGGGGGGPIPADLSTSWLSTSLLTLSTGQVYDLFTVTPFYAQGDVDSGIALGGTSGFPQALVQDTQNRGPSVGVATLDAGFAIERAGYLKCETNNTTELTFLSSTTVEAAVTYDHVNQQLVLTNEAKGSALYLDNTSSITLLSPSELKFNVAGRMARNTQSVVIPTVPTAIPQDENEFPAPTYQSTIGAQSAHFMTSTFLTSTNHLYKLSWADSLEVTGPIGTLVQSGDVIRYTIDNTLTCETVPLSVISSCAANTYARSHTLEWIATQPDTQLEIANLAATASTIVTIIPAHSFILQDLGGIEVVGLSHVDGQVAPPVRPSK